MATNNLEILGYNYLTNLSTINCDEVNVALTLTKETASGTITSEQFDQLYGLDTDQTIQEQIDEIQQEIANIGDNYWGSFYSTQTQTNAGATSVNYFTFNNSDPSNNLVDLSGSTPSSIVKVLNTNVFNIQFSAQFKHTNSSKIDVDIWLVKNGSNVADTNTRFSLDTNDQYVVPAWNFVLPFTAGDYFQLAWSSSDTSVVVQYEAASTSPTRPAIPSIILTVTNVTGVGPQGVQGIQGNTGATGARGPKGDKGDKGDPGDGTVDTVARALAGTAIAEATAAVAGVAALGVTVTGLSGTVSGLSTTVGIQGGKITALEGSQLVQDGKITSLEGKTTNILSAIPLESTTWGGNILLSNYPAGIGTTLSGRGDSEFTYLIRAPRIICSNGTSSFDTIATSDYVNVGGNCEVGGRVVVSRLAALTAGSGVIKAQFSGAADANYNFTGLSNQSDGYVPSMGYHVGWDDGAGHYPAHRFYHATSDSTKKQILAMDVSNHTITTDRVNFYNTATASSNRDCGIDITAATLPLSPDTGTMTIKAGTLNLATGGSVTTVNIATGIAAVNTVNIGSGPLGIVNINGTVNMTGTNFSLTNAFFRQF